jgi:hypothetical protein
MPTYLYNRTKRNFRLVQPRKKRDVEALGSISGCCDRMIVLGHLSDTTSWKNDVTSKFSKLIELTDSCFFELKKNGVSTTYQPTLTKCVNDDYGYYVTINWRDVLASDGQGCYDLILTENILSEESTSTIGEYELKEYTVENALGTIRIKSVFNQFNNIEQIDFTNSNVVDCIRVNGFFGDRQPNTAIDNLIYNDRVSRNVIREHLNVYSLETDPLEEIYTTLIIDLHILSENDMYISDYNDFNHSWSLLDVPVILKDTPQLDYKKYSKLASVKGMFEDKEKYSYSKYNG